MPRLRSTGCTPNDRAICGSAVAITVPSRFSMKNAAATRSAMAVGRVIAAAGSGRVRFCDRFRDRRRAARDDPQQHARRRIGPSKALLPIAHKTEPIGDGGEGAQASTPSPSAVRRIAAHVSTCNGTPSRSRAARVRASGSPGTSTSPTPPAGRAAFT